MLRAEAQIVARSRSPGDCGEHGFHKGQKLLNALFEVQRPPAQGEPLLLSWTMAEDAVGFFRRVARWGYPWRLMDGGRHELGVGAVARDGEVEVRFSAAHDYRRVREEGKEQKTQRKGRAYYADHVQYLFMHCKGPPRLTRHDGKSGVCTTNCEHNIQNIVQHTLISKSVT